MSCLGVHAKLEHVSQGALTYSVLTYPDVQLVEVLTKRRRSVTGTQAELETIRSVLLSRRGALVNMTADERVLAAAQPHVAEFLDALAPEGAPDATWTGALPRLNEALCVPTQVGRYGACLMPSYLSQCGLLMQSMP